MKPKMKSKMKFDFNMKINNKMIVKLLFLAIIAVGFYIFTRPIIEGYYRQYQPLTRTKIPVYDIVSRQKVYNILQTNDTNLTKLFKLKNLLLTDFKKKAPFPFIYNVFGYDINGKIVNHLQFEDINILNGITRNRKLERTSEYSDDDIKTLIPIINLDSPETLLSYISSNLNGAYLPNTNNPLVQKERDDIQKHINFTGELEPASQRLARIKYQLDYDVGINNNKIITNDNKDIANHNYVLRQTAFSDLDPALLLYFITVILTASSEINPAEQRERSIIKYYLNLNESIPLILERIKYQLDYNTGIKNNNIITNHNSNPANRNYILRLIVFTKNDDLYDKFKKDIARIKMLDRVLNTNTKFNPAEQQERTVIKHWLNMTVPETDESRMKKIIGLLKYNIDYGENLNNVPSNPNYALSQIAFATAPPKTLLSIISKLLKPPPLLTGAATATDAGVPLPSLVPIDPTSQITRTSIADVLNNQTEPAINKLNKIKGILNNITDPANPNYVLKQIAFTDASKSVDTIINAISVLPLNSDPTIIGTPPYPSNMKDSRKMKPYNGPEIYS